MVRTSSLDRYVRTRRDRLECECACANSRVYLVGSQNGGFPRMGWHTPGEMSGLWLHPIKLADGFWLQVGDSDTGDTEWLAECTEYTGGPFWGMHTYTGVLRKLRVTRTEFAPDGVDGIAVRYAFRRQDGAERGPRLRLKLSFTVKAHLVAVWGSRRSDEARGSHTGSYLPSVQAVAVTDDRNLGFLIAGIDRPITGHSFAERLSVPDETGNDGVYAQLCSEIDVPAEAETCVNLFLAGSTISMDRAAEALELVRSNHARMFVDRADRIKKQMSVSELSVPDPLLQDAFEFGKLSVEFLERDVEGVGAGICAGLPEYPWWFGCDSCFTVPGLLVSGRSDLAISTMRLLAGATMRDNTHGRVPHEVVTDGTVANPGNTQETPHFISTVREVWKWTGNSDFLKELYPLCKKGFSWLFDEMDEDGDLLPEGYGIAEVNSLDLEMVDTAVHTLKAAESLVDIAEYLGDSEMKRRAAQVHAKLLGDIDRRFWLGDEGIYGDMIAKPSQIMERIKKMRRPGGSRAFRERLEQIEIACREAVDDSERPWSFGLCLTLVMLTDGVIPEHRRSKQIELFESSKYTGPYGILMTGSSEGASMTISTGQMVMGEFLAGRPEKGVDYIHRMQKTAELRFPGYPSEFSPDKGCFVQAWSNYGLVFAVIRGLFGIDPHVPRGRLVVRPCLPHGWDQASVHRLPVGDRLVDIEVRREGRHLSTKAGPSDGRGDMPFKIEKVEVQR